jgi:hypothetical protein
MKRTALILLFGALGAFTAQAQDSSKKDSYPFWTLSKDVQRIQYKNIQFTPSTVVTGNGQWVISKGVHQAQEAPVAANVQTGGRPTWFISKGVARFQAEKK